jgi:zinc/manganese transport system substrate-binding protein
VYGDIAATIGGPDVTVTSILDDPSQDPHSFEGSAQVQLALSKATIVIENGGGYDDWTDTLLAGADNADAVVLNAVDISGFDQEPAEGELNEHVWYDFPTVQKLVERLVSELSTADPANADTFAANAATFETSLDALEAREAELATSAKGTGVAVTEPVPLYLLAASGFTNVTPEAFSEAVEEGSDVSPAVLEKTVALFASGDAALLVYNEQTSGPETEQVIAAAKAAGAGVVPVTETLPTGEHYLDWMSANLDAISAAVR